MHLKGLQRIDVIKTISYLTKWLILSFLRMVVTLDYLKFNYDTPVSRNELEMMVICRKSLLFNIFVTWISNHSARNMKIYSFLTFLQLRKRNHLKLESYVNLVDQFSSSTELHFIISRRDILLKSSTWKDERNFDLFANEHWKYVII